MTILPFLPERFLYGAVGDAHGDLTSLVAAVDAVREKATATGRTAFLIVLGDAIDRGPDSAGCASLLLRLARGRDPERRDVRIAILRGDHDEALARDPATGRFASGVEPADWAERLNGLSPDDPERAVAADWISFVREAPAAVLLRARGEGVLLAHGGVPHADLLPRLETVADLGAPECERDFVWCRVASARRKTPNRGSLTCDLGVDDVSDFLARLAALAGAAQGEDARPFRVRHFVHGHEHAAPGVARQALRDGATAWTVTTFRDDGGGFLDPVRPAVALIDRAEGAEEPFHAEFAVSAMFVPVAEEAKGAEA